MKNPHGRGGLESEFEHKPQLVGMILGGVAYDVIEATSPERAESKSTVPAIYEAHVSEED